MSAYDPKRTWLRSRLGATRSAESAFKYYLSLEVWPARHARNAASACSRSSALLILRRGCFGGSAASGILPLTSSTPCRRIRRRCCIRYDSSRPVLRLSLLAPRKPVLLAGQSPIVVRPVLVA